MFTEGDEPGSADPHGRSHRARRHGQHPSYPRWQRQKVRTKRVYKSVGPMVN